jgi:hypothetical protein
MESQAQNRALRDLIREIIPTVQSDLDEAVQVQGQLGTK